MLKASERSLRALAHHELLDLAGRGLGQRAKNDAAWRLVMREVVAAEGDDLFGRRRLLPVST
jgi:hypothetical protein